MGQLREDNFLNSLNARVPFNDLGRGTAILREEINAAVTRVLDSGWFVMGPEHEALERELAEFIGVNHVINVANGTDALELGLAALGVGTGDLVMTVANAGAYTTTAALLLGAEPVYVDVDPQTLLMSGATFEAALSRLDIEPKAVVVTHLYGALAPIEEIVRAAHARGIPVLEDCAQSLGATMNGKRGGSFADIATTSFYPTKNLGALGDGGAAFTNSDELAESLRSMRQYGWASKYSIEHGHGRNSRLDEIQAAILRVKLPYLDRDNDRRRAIHSSYETAEHVSARVLNRSNESFIGHLAVVVAENRPEARATMEEAGVKTELHYPISDHRQKFPTFTPRPMSLEVTEWASEHVFSVPLFPQLTDDEVRTVTQAIAAI